jgi:hypothetical protein
VQPLIQQLGFEAKPGETPEAASLRRSTIAALGAWDDPDTVAYSRSRLSAFLADHGAIAPDDQTTILGIVAAHADQTTFEQLHALAKSATTSQEQDRLYSLLGMVKDPMLVQPAIDIALSPEIPPQSALDRLQILGQLSNYHQRESWNAVTANIIQLTKPFGNFKAQVLGTQFPAIYWRGVPLDEIQAFLDAQIIGSDRVFITRGMESARYDRKRARLLVTGVGLYLAGHASNDRSPLAVPTSL